MRRLAALEGQHRAGDRRTVAIDDAALEAGGVGAGGEPRRSGHEDEREPSARLAPAIETLHWPPLRDGGCYRGCVAVRGRTSAPGSRPLSQHSDRPDADERVGRPWWTYAVPYFGAMPELKRGQWRMLGLLVLAELFDQYDVGLLGLSLKQVQDELLIPETEIAGVTAIVRLGVLPAILLTMLADRIGRRQLLLVTILGFTVATVATAFAQNAIQFTIFQFIARAFIYAETMLAVVVLAEELESRDRGFGIGLLGAIGMLGHAFSAIAFGFVDDLPYGWRALYALGGLPLLGLAWMRRNLPETKRFEAQQADRQSEPFLKPLVRLFQSYPRRILCLGLALAPIEFVVITAQTFIPKLLQEMHGFAPSDVTVLYIAGGALGILGNLMAGTGSDRIGRRPMILLLTCGVAAGLWGFMNLSGTAIVVFWVVQLFSMTGLNVLFKAIGSELFPTSYRSTASAARAILGTLGGVVGLSIEGSLFTAAGSHAAAITWMIPVMLLSPLVVLLALPETSGRELEDIAPERS